MIHGVFKSFMCKYGKLILTGGTQQFKNIYDGLWNYGKKKH